MIAYITRQQRERDDVYTLLDPDPRDMPKSPKMAVLPGGVYRAEVDGHRLARWRKAVAAYEEAQAEMGTAVALVQAAELTRRKDGLA